MKKQLLPQLTKPLTFCFVLSLIIATAFLWQVAVTSAEKVSQKITSPQTTENKIGDLTDSPVFVEFEVWAREHLERGSAVGSQHNKMGESLAIKRRQLLKELIQLDPQAALERAIPLEIYNRLPAFITEHLERRISADGDFLVIIKDEIDSSTGKLTGHQTERETVIDNVRYQAFVYGRRETMTTKFNIPLSGIVLGEMMAVNESPLQKLEVDEYAARNVDAAKVRENRVVAEVGGKLVYFANDAELDKYVREQIEWEAKIGPERESENENALLSPWTEGNKTVLFIRVDFPDDIGEPLTQTQAQSIMDAQVNPFFVNNSYNKTTLQTTVTPVIRLPQPKTYYQQGANYSYLLTHARTVARAAGFETNNFNLDIVAFRGIGGGWAGRGYLGAKGTWLNGYFDLWVTGHELGHNFGLHHANFWRTTNGTTTGPGSSSEYADPFDMMGNSGNSVKHFSTPNKRRLDWLTDANVQSVTSSGIYRIYAFDTPQQATRLHALKIKKDSTLNYWVEFRQLITNNPGIMNGAVVRWAYNNAFSKTELLDAIPATSTAGDAPLLVGQTLDDSASGIKITVLGKGNTTPESLDVRVEINPPHLFDFDGDGKDDVSVFRPSSGTWFLNRSTAGFAATQFGTNGDLLAPADFDGDKKTDVSVFRPSTGTWFRLNSLNNTFASVQFGTSGDAPRPADFDGDGRADISVWRPSSGTWYRLNSSNGQFVSTQFGLSGDVPIMGNFDGDNKDDIAVWRPSNGNWYRLNSTNGQFVLRQFGLLGDVPTAADYDGDGQTDIAVWRPSSGIWYRLNSNGGGFVQQQFGLSTDVPTPADYDGDGKADLAVFRRSNSTWYLSRSAQGLTTIQFGLSTDKPVPSAFLP